MKEADLALLRRFAQDHDAEAFSEIVGRYQNLVYGTCVRILGDATDAEDVAQECFMGLMRKAGTVRSSLAGWLHRCAADMSVNELRRCAARKKREESSCKMNSSVNNGPSWHEVAPYVDGALNELPDDLRIVIVEHFLQRRTQAEIAKELGVSAMTVSRRVEAGLDELRKKLKKAGLIVSAALLASLIAEHAVSAAPAALTVALGKMALAGTVKGGAATGAATGWTGAGAVAGSLAAAAKIKIVAVVAAAVLAVGGVTAYKIAGGPRATDPAAPRDTGGAEKEQEGEMPVPEPAGEVGAAAPPTAPEKAVASPLDLLPGDLKGLGFVNLKELAEAGVLEKHFELVLDGVWDGKEPRELNKKIRLGPEDGLEALAAGFDPGSGPVVVITGRFDTDAIYSVFATCNSFGTFGALGTHGVKGSLVLKSTRDEGEEVEPTTYKGHKLLCTETGVFIAVLDEKVLVFGSEEVGRKAVDIYVGDAEPEIWGSALIERVGGFLPRAGEGATCPTFWLTADLPPGMGVGSPIAAMMPGLDPSKIRYLTLSGRAAERDPNLFDLEAVLGCEDADSAGNLAGALKQGVNALALMVPVMFQGKPEVAQVLDELIKGTGITARGASAVLELSFSFDKLAAMLGGEAQPEAYQPRVGAIELFGAIPPAVERTVNDAAEGKDSLIDFDTGKLYTQPENADLRAFIRENGIDAQADTSIRGFRCFDMAVVSFREVLPKIEVHSGAIDVSAMIDELRRTRFKESDKMSGEDGLPTGFEFVTREGGAVWLTISEANNDERPRHVKIRYEMIGKRPIPGDPQIKEIKPMRVACVRHVGRFNDFDQAGKKLSDWINKKEQEGVLGPKAVSVIISYDDPDLVEPEKLRWDIGIKVPNDKVFEQDSPVQFRDIGGGEHAVITYPGPYEGAIKAIRELTRWLHDNGREIRADTEGVLLIQRHPQPANPLKPVIDICVPLAPLNRDEDADPAAHRRILYDVDDDPRSNILDVVTRELLKVPETVAKDGGAFTRWIAQQQGKAYVGFDNAEGGGLIAVRGAKLAVLGTQDWEAADALTDADLRQQIEEKGDRVVRLKEFAGRPGPWPAFVGVRTRENRLAVIRARGFVEDSAHLWPGLVVEVKSRKAVALRRIQLLDKMGPVVERTVNDDAEPENNMLDLDTGKLFSPPNKLPEGISVWAFFRKQGVDVMVETGGDARGLIGIDMAVMPLPGKELINVKELVDELVRQEPLVQRGNPMSAKEGVPAEFLFITREGSVGRLTIVEVNNDKDKRPCYAKIRYQMIGKAYP